MRWLVVRVWCPEAKPPPSSAHAHPPGPGLPRQAPSVNTIVDVVGLSGTSAPYAGEAGRRGKSSRPRRLRRREVKRRFISALGAFGAGPLGHGCAWRRTLFGDIDPDVPARPPPAAPLMESVWRSARFDFAPLVPAWAHDHRRVRPPAPGHRPHR